jgi:GAF domain-containing protein
MSAVCEPQASPLKIELNRTRTEHAYLQKQLEREKQKRRRVTTRYIELQERYTKLARLQAAAERLLAPQSRAQVYSAIQEVVAKLVGSEQVGVFLFDQQNCNLHLVASCGIDSGQFSTVSLGSSLIGRSAATGYLFIAQSPEASNTIDCFLAFEDTLTACIPLRHSGLLLGAIAIFGLLDQREGFDAEDVELFEAIAKWTSLALRCTAIDWGNDAKGRL